MSLIRTRGPPARRDAGARPRPFGCAGPRGLVRGQFPGRVARCPPPRQAIGRADIRSDCTSPDSTSRIMERFILSSMEWHLAGDRAFTICHCISIGLSCGAYGGSIPGPHRRRSTPSIPERASTCGIRRCRSPMPPCRTFDRAFRKTLNILDLVERAAITCSAPLPKAPNTFSDLLEKVFFSISHPPRPPRPQTSPARLGGQQHGLLVLVKVGEPTSRLAGSYAQRWHAGPFGCLVPPPRRRSVRAGSRAGGWLRPGHGGLHPSSSYHQEGGGQGRDGGGQEGRACRDAVPHCNRRRLHALGRAGPRTNACADVPYVSNCFAF